MLSSEFLKNSNNSTDNHKNDAQILIVEDHTLSAHIASRFLTDLGCYVEYAVNGQIALEKFELHTDHQYDLIFMDISLPDIDGYALVKKIKATQSFQKRPIAIIALTVYDGKDNERKCLAAGMNAVLVKPLLKTTAQQILETFIPKWTTKNLSVEGEDIHHYQSNSEITGVPIDFSQALILHDGDVDFIKSALQVIVESLDSELEQLKLECEYNNWGAGRVIIHKLQGGTRYFGLTRLDQVCIRFTKVLKDSPELNWPDIYALMLKEVGMVRQAYDKWLQEQSI